MTAPRFPPTAIARMRQLHEGGLLDVRAWAREYGVSLETVRRAARGDTYRPAAGTSGPPRFPPGQVLVAEAEPPDEPDEQGIAASFARLAVAQAAEARRPSADALLDELLARGREQPGLPGGTAPAGHRPPDVPDAAPGV